MDIGQPLRQNVAYFRAAAGGLLILDSVQPTGTCSVSIKKDAPFLPHMAKAVDEVPEELDVGAIDPPPDGADLPPLDGLSGVTGALVDGAVSVVGGVLGVAGEGSGAALGGVLDGIAGEPGAVLGGIAGDWETGAGLSFCACPAKTEPKVAVLSTNNETRQVETFMNDTSNVLTSFLRDRLR